jgi:hypothetical protein
VSATGVASCAVCHPEALSPVNVTVANRCPVDDHSDPVWVPVFVAPLKNRIAVTEPAADVLNDMPSSTLDVSESDTTDGVMPLIRLNVSPVGAAAVVNDHAPPVTAAPPRVTAAEYTVDDVRAAVGVNVTTLVVALYVDAPATAPAGVDTSMDGVPDAGAADNVADTEPDTATFVAPAAGLVDDTDTAAGAAAVVNDHAPPVTAAPARVTAAEYTVDAVKAAVGVNVTTRVVALYVDAPATVPAAVVNPNAGVPDAGAADNVADTAPDTATFVAPAAGVVPETVTAAGGVVVAVVKTTSTK